MKHVDTKNDLFITKMCPTDTFSFPYHFLASFSLLSKTQNLKNEQNEVLDIKKVANNKDQKKNLSNS